MDFSRTHNLHNCRGLRSLGVRVMPCRSRSPQHCHPTAHKGRVGWSIVLRFEKGAAHVVEDRWAKSICIFVRVRHSFWYLLYKKTLSNCGNHTVYRIFFDCLYMFIFTNVFFSANFPLLSFHIFQVQLFSQHFIVHRGPITFVPRWLTTLIFHGGHFRCGWRCSSIF